jgi:hypothetical protein
MMAEVLVTAILSGWLCATIAFNVPFVERHVGRFATRRIWALVPNWSFFAPRPAMTDTLLFYRDRYCNGACSPWRQAELVLLEHRFRRAAWNPGARVDKALADAESLLIQDDPRPGNAFSKGLALTVPYLLLLNWVCSFPVGAGAVARQFSLVRHSRCGEEIEIVLVSGFHGLDSEEEGLGQEVGV